jgi:hypothetical protein
MTTLELLSWARKGIAADKVKFQAAQEEALKGQNHVLAGMLQEEIDLLDVKAVALDDLEEIHNRKY